MRLLFKQRFFSWFDSYDIYDEEGRTVFTVQGRLAWGHCLEIHDGAGGHIGTVKEEVLTFLPRFRLYLGGSYAGEIRKELTLFRPSFRLDLNGWRIQGNFLEWDYEIEDEAGRLPVQAAVQLDGYLCDRRGAGTGRGLRPDGGAGNRCGEMFTVQLRTERRNGWISGNVFIII